MPSNSTYTDELLMHRIRILDAELRALRHAHRTIASGANVHVMQGIIADIQMALWVAEKAVVNAQPETIPALLLIAKEGLSEARALHFQTARTRRWRA